jgi:glycogen operon protein
VTAEPLPGFAFDVRTEGPEDRAAVHDVVARAFGQTDEADLIEAMRGDPAWIDGFSVVGVRDGRVVGHALLTRLPVGADPGLALAPVAVAPEAQRTGVGSAMVRELVRRAEAAGERLIVVVGEPDYYRRFGFAPAADLGVVGFDQAGPAFQAMTLGDPALAPRGRVRYPAPFGITEAESSSGPGRQPLGATWDGSGTTFALWSSAAEQVVLCTFDDRGVETSIRLDAVGEGVWSGRIPGLGPGQRYGYRIHGRWDPAGSGSLCEPARLVLDPWAKAITGRPTWHPTLFPDWSRRTSVVADTALHMPRCLVVDPTFDWRDDRPPNRPLSESVIYEVHVKGFTALHPRVPQGLRGTFAGLAHPAAIDHLVGLGVTAVELLPVHHFVHEPRLERLGLRNYWGYASIGFLAPHGGYAAAGDRGGQIAEFQGMVRALHAAGLEVILDVVYNHTGEGDEAGPVLSFKGIDNAAYYRLQPGAPDRYWDVTATGNTLDTRQPIVRRLILDSLRYWVEVMHIDGFRFDLAGALGRGAEAFDPQHPLLEAIRADPVISRAKLIAEPWDAGPGGHQAGRFPAPFAEWNDGFRDTVRDLWRGGLESAAGVGRRLTGSADRFEATGRFPAASINYVTSHDGFPLADVVAYERKHNHQNGEGNRDGEERNRSWNHGAEGATGDPSILAARRQTQRNLLATLLLSQGVPMLLGGDEIGRSQRGNNNAYCQDNQISWLEWDTADRGLLGFVGGLIALRRAHPVFRRRHWLANDTGHPADWFRLDGAPMTAADWERGPVEGLQLRLDGRLMVAPDVPDVPDGADGNGDAGNSDAGSAAEAELHRCDDATFCLMINAGPHDREVRVAPGIWPGPWRVLIDTSFEEPFPQRSVGVPGGGAFRMRGRSLLLLKQTPPVPEAPTQPPDDNVGPRFVRWP